MPTDTEDVELESSTSTDTDAQPSTPAEDSALDTTSDDAATAGGEQGDEDQSTPDSATAGADKSKTPEKTKSPAEEAMDFLSGKTQRDEAKAKQKADELKKQEEATSKDTKDGKKDGKKEDEKVSFELTKNDLRAHPQTRDRIKKLLGDYKGSVTERDQLREQMKAHEPTIKAGQAFQTVVKDYQLTPDLEALGEQGDTVVAASIQYVGAIARMGQGKATQADIERVKSVGAGVLRDLEAFGLAPKAAPTIDHDAIDKALKIAEDTFDFTEVRKLLSAAKVPQQHAAPVQQRQHIPTGIQPAQPIQRQPEPVQPGNTPDDIYYESKIATRFKADKIGNPAEYFEKQILPQLLPVLKATAPGKDPLKNFWDLSPRARHEMTIEAHEDLLKKAERLKAPPQKPTPGQRSQSPGAGQGPAWGKKPAAMNTAEDAINFLAGD